MKYLSYLELNDYLPNGAFYLVEPLLKVYKFELIITKKRNTLLGNYIYNPYLQTDTITINEDLNPYAFLLTLLHELAHLYTHKKYGNSVAPHGIEWKKTFSDILVPFLEVHIFSPLVESVIAKNLNNLKATSCADIELYKALKMYDTTKANNGNVFIDSLIIGDEFIYNKKKFKVLQKLRKRIQCQELQTKKQYLFNPVCEVQKG